MDEQTQQARDAQEFRASAAASPLRRLSSVSISSASKSDQDRTFALLRRVRSTTSEASASLGTMASTMHAAQQVQKETGQLLAQWFSGLSVREMERRLREAFARLDKDGSNTIDIAEFAEITQVLGLSLSPDRISGLFADVDADGSGTISFEELRHAVRKSVKEPCDRGCPVCCAHQQHQAAGEPRAPVYENGSAEYNTEKALQRLQAAVRRSLQVCESQPSASTHSSSEFSRLPMMPRSKSSDELAAEAAELRVRLAVDELACMKRSISDPTLREASRASDSDARLDQPVSPRQEAEEAEEAAYIHELELEVSRLEKARELSRKSTTATSPTFPPPCDRGQPGATALSAASTRASPGLGSPASKMGPGHGPGEMLRQAGARLRDRVSRARDQVRCVRRGVRAWVREWKSSLCLCACVGERVRIFIGKQKSCISHQCYRPTD